MSLKVNQHILLTLALTLLLNGSYTLWGQTSTSQPVTSSGTEFMVPKKEVNGKLIGQEDVLIQEVVITDSGRQYRRLDVGVSGTIDGWAVKEGSATQRRQFGSAPEFTFTQVGNVYRRFHGIVRYEAFTFRACALFTAHIGRVGGSRTSEAKKRSSAPSILPTINLRNLLHNKDFFLSFRPEFPHLAV